jgi:hypothetical protein
MASSSAAEASANSAIMNGGSVMPTAVKCNGCGKTWKFPDAARGKSAKCPACQFVIEIPNGANAEPTPKSAQPEGSVCADCGTKLTTLNRAHGMSKPQCASCYRKANDIASLTDRDKWLGKSSWQTRIIAGGILILAAIGIFVVGAMMGSKGPVDDAAFMMQVFGSLFMLVGGASAIASGIKKRSADRSESSQKLAGKV